MLFERGEKVPGQGLGHGWLDHLDAVLATVADPDFREPDPIIDRERFYRQSLDRRRWLRVVVDFGDIPAWIVTALIQPYDPRR
jgi:hypothetical protein